MATPQRDLEMFRTRVGDTEREGCLEVLNDHHACGRLSVEELDQRQRAALIAVTEADLAALVADLPREAQSGLERRATSTGITSRPGQANPEAVTVARWVVPPVSLVAGAWFVAIASGQNGPEQFASGMAMGLLGIAVHWFFSRTRKN